MLRMVSIILTLVVSLPVLTIFVLTATTHVGVTLGTIVLLVGALGIARLLTALSERANNSN